MLTNAGNLAFFFHKSLHQFIVHKYVSCRPQSIFQVVVSPAHPECDHHEHGQLDQVIPLCAEDPGPSYAIF
jgi:hypothetical protein